MVISALQIFRLAAIFLFTWSSISGTNGQCGADIGCKDCYSWCSSYSNLCGSATVMTQFCRKTCQSCVDHPLCDEAKCEHRCLLAPDNTTADCVCFEGYSRDGDGKTCTDINECESEENPCKRKDSPLCVNTDGEHFCVSCRAINPSKIWSYYNRDECCTRDHESVCGKAWGSRLSHNSPKPNIQQFPWTAYITVNGNQCDGTLIDDRFVLTAAHCLEGVDSADQVLVSLGVQKVGGTQNLHVQTFSVRRFSRHPNYSFPLNDISVLELNRDVVKSAFASPVCLPGGHEPTVGEICYATGYGSIQLNASGFKEVGLSIADHTLCKRAFDNDQHAVNSNLHLCAEKLEGEEYACPGYFGGPLVCQRCNSCDWYIAGIASFSKNCDVPGFYGVYTRAVAFEEWITSITNQQFVQSTCVKPTWSEWSEWSSCSKSCGRATRSRSRSCLNGELGVLGCLGAATMTRKCDLRDC